MSDSFALTSAAVPPGGQVLVSQPYCPPPPKKKQRSSVTRTLSSPPNPLFSRQTYESHPHQGALCNVEILAVR